MARVALQAQERPNERWSMDFTGDTLANGRTFRTLNVVDDASRECLAIEVDHGLSGKPVDNAFVESFNGKFRDECLNENWFLDLSDARQGIEDRRRDYNTVRPHSALGNRTPEDYAATAGRTT